MWLKILNFAKLLSPFLNKIAVMVTLRLNLPCFSGNRLIMGLDYNMWPNLV